VTEILLYEILIEKSTLPEPLQDKLKPPASVLISEDLGLGFPEVLEIDPKREDNFFLAFTFLVGLVDLWFADTFIRFIVSALFHIYLLFLFPQKNQIDNRQSDVLPQLPFVTYIVK